MQPELLNAVKARDGRAFKQMYEMYIRYIYSIVSRYHSMQSDYPDIIQEIFANIFLKINTYDPSKGEFKGWIRSIAINQCIKYYHSEKRQIDTTSLDTIATHDHPVDFNIDRFSRDDLVKILSTMPSGYREVFMLFTVDGFSHQEISELLKISTETSRSQLHRAKIWLRKYLATNKIKTLSNA